MNVKQIHSVKQEETAKEEIVMEDETLPTGKDFFHPNLICFRSHSPEESLPCELIRRRLRFERRRGEESSATARKLLVKGVVLIEPEGYRNAGSRGN